MDEKREPKKGRRAHDSQPPVNWRAVGALVGTIVVGFAETIRGQWQQHDTLSEFRQNVEAWRAQQVDLTAHVKLHDRELLELSEQGRDHQTWLNELMMECRKREASTQERRQSVGRHQSTP